MPSALVGRSRKKNPLDTGHGDESGEGGPVTSPSDSEWYIFSHIREGDTKISSEKLGVSPSEQEISEK